MLGALYDFLEIIIVAVALVAQKDYVERFYSVSSKVVVRLIRTNSLRGTRRERLPGRYASIWPIEIQ